MKVFYLRDSQRRPVATIGSEIDPLVSEHVRFAVATCNTPLDYFIKSRGRYIVEQRLKIGKVGIVNRDGNVKRDIMETIIAWPEEYPIRTCAAAQLWLDTHPASDLNNE